MGLFIHPLWPICIKVAEPWPFAVRTSAASSSSLRWWKHHAQLNQWPWTKVTTISCFVFGRVHTFTKKRIVSETNYFLQMYSQRRVKYLDIDSNGAKSVSLFIIYGQLVDLGCRPWPFAVRTFAATSLSLCWWQHHTQLNQWPWKKVTTISCFVFERVCAFTKESKVSETNKCTHKFKIFHFHLFFKLKWPSTLKWVFARFCPIVFGS